MIKMTRREFIAVGVATGIGLATGIWYFFLRYKGTPVTNVTSTTNVTETVTETTKPHITPLEFDPLKLYFNPLNNIYVIDYFDSGMNDWVNRSGKSLSVGTIPDPQNRPPERGGLSGNQVLRLENQYNLERNAEKVISTPYSNIIRWETYLINKNHTKFYVTKPDYYLNYQLKCMDSMLLNLDLYDNGKIYRFNLKWLNYDGEELKRYWQVLNEDGNTYDTKGIQELCYNESYKYDWVYLRLDMDIKNKKFIQLQCMNKIFDLNSAIPVLAIPVLDSVGINSENGLIKYGYGITSSMYRPDINLSSWLYIDSIIISGD